MPEKSTFHEYLSQQSRKIVNLPDSTPSPSSFTADNLNSFILEKIEPDTAYNQRCKAVVNRLCHFMQNNFPNKLRPSEVVKVNLVTNLVTNIEMISLSLSLSRYFLTLCKLFIRLLLVHKINITNNWLSIANNIICIVWIVIIFIAFFLKFT